MAETLLCLWNPKKLLSHLYLSFTLLRNDWVSRPFNFQDVHVFDKMKSIPTSKARDPCLKQLQFRFDCRDNSRTRIGTTKWNMDKHRSIQLISPIKQIDWSRKAFINRTAVHALIFKANYLYQVSIIKKWQSLLQTVIDPHV